MALEEGPEIGREPSRRLFFALWPDEAMRHAMAQATRKAVRASGGRPVPVENLHVTLAFLGSVREGRLTDLVRVAQQVAGTAGAASGGAEAAAHPLELVFERLEHWRAARLLCALPAESPVTTAALARRLQDLLTSQGFAPDLKPFRPHVTVARKVSRPGRLASMPPVVWRFAQLALIESRTLPALSPDRARGEASGNGPLYSVVESFPLCSGRAKSSAASNAANNIETR